MSREFATLKVGCEPGLTPAAFVALVGQLSPADAVAVLRKAVNYTLTGQRHRCLEKADIERALIALSS